MTVENRLGSQCSGTSGQPNRVLTLTNVNLTTSDDFAVFVTGKIQSLSIDYTVVHTPTNTKITFLRNISNENPIIVSYETTTASSGGIGKNDFINGPLKEFGRDYTKIRITDTLDSMGGKTVATETSETISGIIIFVTEKDRRLLEMGLARIGDAKFLVDGNVDLLEGDIIQDSGKKWRITQINGNRQDADETVFISAIMRNIGLDQ